MRGQVYDSVATFSGTKKLCSSSLCVHYHLEHYMCTAGLMFSNFVVLQQLKAFQVSKRLFATMMSIWKIFHLSKEVFCSKGDAESYKSSTTEDDSSG